MKKYVGKRNKLAHQVEKEACTLTPSTPKIIYSKDYITLKIT